MFKVQQQVIDAEGRHPWGAATPHTYATREEADKAKRAALDAHMASGGREGLRSVWFRIALVGVAACLTIQ